MLLSDVRIPVALQLVLDDVGWMYGRDERWENYPSRTGMPRRHVLEDYVAINEVGRAINMEIHATFVIGEWDKWGVLRKVPNSNPFGENWNGSPHLNVAEAEKIRDYINGSEYIEIALHGLLHDYWYNGVNIGGREYEQPEGNVKGGKGIRVSNDYLRTHLDAFMEIYNNWGFTKPIRSFCCPGGAGTAWKDDEFSFVLKEYGIKYWCNGGIDRCRVSNGIIINPKAVPFLPWEAYDINPAKLETLNPETSGIISGHWPCLLRYDPELNLERVGDWKKYFQRQANVFGHILPRDIAFTSHQQLYRYFAKLSEHGDMIKLDLTKADEAYPNKQPIYISVKDGAAPTECIGGVISEYEKMEGFINYKIDRTATSIIYIK